jgi:tetratricopeptide (TPR) repeat protein/tRNA A-37 threonylcarbamoyl transferase component Bud32
VTTACPTDEDLVRLIEGSIAAATLSALEQHVDSCDDCATVIAGLGALGSAAHRRVLPDHPTLVTVDADHYVLGDEIARGGMGRILRARDRRLGRQIAIKENLAATGDHAHRFEREARITARLQHPSIVHVHEAGVWPSGEPFFAMDLVAGRSFDEVIARATTLEQRLALIPNVLAVADAIAYAHHQGVIHRDLKPKNVLVGDFGETVVIDWGLAKDLSGPAEPEDASSAPVLDGATEAGKVVGTPAYMPPEQARGEAVDPRTDVYALGAVLFHLLAGRPPISGRNGDEVLARILAGPLPSLAEVQPGVPPDLLAIVTKAMAFAPGGRYPSARELADDLRQYQTGQLVGAHRYSLGQLARRWLRRHRAAVAVAAAAAVVLIAVSGVALRRVVHAETVAQSERRAAERDRADAEELMGFMLGDLRAKLDPLGKLDLLDLVATKATAYYDRRPARTDHDRRARSLALENVGDVRLAQGRSTAALASYCDALAITEVLAAQAPGDVALQRTLEVKHDRVGDALGTRGDSAGALAEYRADMTIAQRLAARDPSNADWQRDLSISHEKLGDILDAQGKLGDALVEYRASLAIMEVVAARSSTPADERGLSVEHERLGETLAHHGDVAAALTEHRAALAIREQLVARDPKDMILARDLAASHIQLGATLEQIEDVPNALREYRAALAIHERLVARDPSNEAVQSELGVIHEHIGKALRLQGDNAGALAELRAATTLEARLAASDPNDTVRQADLALTRRGLGDVLRAQGDAAAALAEYGATLDIVSKLAAHDPHEAQWQHDLALVHEKIGGIRDARGDLAAALADYRACLAIRERLVASDPTNTAAQTDLAAIYFNVGDVLAKSDLAGALVAHRAALTISEALVAGDPSRTAWRHDVAESHRTIGRLLRAQGHADAARAELVRALALYEKLRAAEPANQDLRADVAKLRVELSHR